MKFYQFLNKSFPELSVKRRTDLGMFHNFVKFLAIRFAFILFKLKVSANLLDVISLMLSIIGFCFLYLSILGHKIIPTIGALLIFFHVWVDFIDGLLARAQDAQSSIGHQLDNLGNDVDRFMLIVLLGIFTENIIFIIINVFIAYVLVPFHRLTKDDLISIKRVDKLKFIYSHKLSLLGVRFLLGVMPLLILFFIWTGKPLNIFGLSFSLLYAIFALMWLIICIPKINK